MDWRLVLLSLFLLAPTSRAADLSGSGGGGGGGGLASVESDPAPKLGGALDVNGNPITSSSDGDIILIPDGTGQVVVIAPFVAVGSGTITRGLRVGETGSFKALHSTESITTGGSVNAIRYQIGGTTVIAVRSNSLFLGNGAGGLSTASDVVFIGENSGAAATSLGFSVCVGQDSCKTYTSGGGVVGIGHRALEIATGNDNTSAGESSLRALGAGVRNSALGSSAGLGATGNSFRNVFVGYHSGFTAGVKEDNVFLGDSAGQLATTANNNIFIGFQAGNLTTTGDNNIIIGYDIDPSAADASNELNIGGLITSPDITTNEVNFGGFQGAKVSTISADGRWTQHINVDCLLDTPDALGQFCLDPLGFYVATGTALGQFTAVKYNSPHGIINMSTAALTTTPIATQNVFVVPTGTSTIDSGFSIGFDSPGQHRLRYTGNATQHLNCLLTGALEIGAAATAHVRLTINADPTTAEAIEHSIPVSVTNTSEFVPFSVHRYIELKTNDEVVLMVGNTTGTADIDITYTLTCTTL